MKPLKTTQKVLSWLFVCPIDESISRRQKLIYIVLVLEIIAADFSITASSVAFINKYISINMSDTFYAVFQLVSAIHILIVFCLTYFTRKKINSIFSNLSKIYGESKFAIFLPNFPKKNSIYSIFEHFYF